MTEEQNAYEYAYPPRASRTPVETACPDCGQPWHTHYQGAKWDSPDGCPVPPSPEAVEPPLTDERCETCGWVVSWCACDEPVSPPLQEGGGWTRLREYGAGTRYAVWANPEGQEVHIYADHEAAIRAEAEGRLARGIVLRETARAERAEQERDKYHTALEAANIDRDRAVGAWEDADRQRAEAEERAETAEELARWWEQNAISWNHRRLNTEEENRRLQSRLETLETAVREFLVALDGMPMASTGPEVSRYVEAFARLRTEVQEENTP